MLSDSMRQICNDTLVLILAGGQGSRLHELTHSRAKPGLEFGGNYRIIDFPLSNCINSGLKQIGVVTQYKARGLIHHLVNGWAKSNQQFGRSFELLPASQQKSENWYQGTADALYQNIEFIRSVAPKYVLVLSGDHIYKMNYAGILSEHVSTGADLTVSCIEVPIKAAAGQFGVMEVDCNDRIIAFEEKPQRPKGLCDSPDFVLASMGNYVFNTDFLLEQLSRDAQIGDSAHDFGKDIIPSVIAQYQVHAHRFRDSRKETAPYWRDVGTLDSYWNANMALLSESPEFDLHEPEWPIWSYQQSMPPVKFIAGKTGIQGAVTDSLISNGCVVTASQIEKSVLFPKVCIEYSCVIQESILLPDTKVGEGAIIKRAIIDRHCQIPAGFQVGVNVKDDINRGFRVTQAGVVLVTQRMLDKLSEEPRRLPDIGIASRANPPRLRAANVIQQFDREEVSSNKKYHA
ncbi:glucose-1-phosphate adenylyltransferase [Aliiglaciecola sp. LCG003]|uniref:glucose-1-phosphate adenylyltransferase n=1 Tax=Aliiglaciecola sp. LCG003 TaxID=3053655 RepID=UPI0025732BFB|nr:glucose-1-phosphate adenylyltransferase [Aliiglaciecola sp. LCG003]WJG11272.1 glucose-1-phosphate adenylyltransferase [Aliiglaciecola sp. LCG003]